MHVKSKAIKLFGLLIIAALVLSALPVNAALAAQQDAPSALQAGADRLVETQNPDGGWGWPLTGTSPENTIGPIGMGLAQAYFHTADPAHYAALQQAGAKLLTKTTFTTHDGYLAAQLDQIFGGSTYRDYVKVNFYDKLAADAYVRGATTYNTQNYVTFLRSARTGQSANLAGWDLGMGLVSAVRCGVTGPELGYWIGATFAEIDEFAAYINDTDVMWYLPTGLAGALYGLTVADVAKNEAYADYKVELGLYAGKNFPELFDILASYQIPASGGIAWHPDWIIADDFNESVQATAYAILALNEYDRVKYLGQIQAAADYLMDVQLDTNGWSNYQDSITENNEVTGEALWGISVAYPEVWVCLSGDCGHPGFAFDNIQVAADTVPAGGVVHVGPGTYNVANQGYIDKGLIKINKPVTISGEPGAIIDGSGEDGIFKIHNTFFGGVVVIEGFELTGDAATSIAITAQKYQPTGQEKTIIIRNNKFHGMTGGINFWGTTTHIPGTPDPAFAITSNIQIVDNEFYDLVASVEEQAIGIVLEDLAGTTKTGGQYAAIIEGNTFRNISDKSETEPGIAIVIPRANAVNGEAVNFQAKNNTFTDAISVAIAIAAEEGAAAYPEIVGNQFNNTGAGIVNTITASIDAEANWWGASTGPAAGKITGNVDATPWCGDADCTFTVSSIGAEGEIILPENAEPQNVQAAINAVPEGSTIVIPAGTIQLLDENHKGFEITTPNLTIKLSDGTIVQNSSPCFTINASNTTITSDGLAQCVATNGSNGIDVTAGLSNIIIENLMITDDNSSSTGDGIHFAGAISDLVIRDTFIAGMPQNGIYFAETPSGIVEINGNAFVQNGALGIKDDGVGSFNALYNSWGSYDAPVAGVNHSLNITAVPYTFASLTMESSGSPWVDQVVSGEEITYTVYGDFVNVNAADFTVVYPVELTYARHTFGTDLVSTNEVTFHDANTRTLHYVGAKQAAGAVATGQKVKLFDVTFTAGAPVVEAPLAFLESLPMFGMPSAGSSTNVFPSQVLNGEVTIIDPPEITSTDIQGYYLTGETREFQVTATNPATGGDYDHVLFQFTVANKLLADISQFQYFDTTWKDMPLAQVGDDLVGYFGPSEGFPMAPGYSATTTLRITFAQPGDYPFVLTLVDKDASDAVLATFSETAAAYDAPSITSADLNSTYLAGVSQEFTVSTSNPVTGGDYEHVLYQFTVAGKSASDISQFQYFDTSESVPTWKDMPLSEDGSGNLVGYFGPSGGFPMVPGFSADTLFRVTFATGGYFPVNIKLVDVDMADRLLAELDEKGLTVYSNYNVTGTVSMQGRSYRGGVVMTLTDVGDADKTYTATSTTNISQNLSFSNVIAGDYWITTTQDRYLNIAANTIQATIDQIVEFLHLKLIGGNANNDDAINISDASMIGTDYGATGVPTTGAGADVNFDGKVNILDLALVGGNFGLTASDYASTGAMPWYPTAP